MIGLFKLFCVCLLLKDIGIIFILFKLNLGINLLNVKLLKINDCVIKIYLL